MLGSKCEWGVKAKCMLSGIRKVSWEDRYESNYHSVISISYRHMQRFELGDSVLSSCKRGVYSGMYVQVEASYVASFSESEWDALSEQAK